MQLAAIASQLESLKPAFFDAYADLDRTSLKADLDRTSLKLDSAVMSHTVTVGQ